MKNLVIIRTCKRDDFIAWYCYQSFKKLNIDADYIFFAEDSYIPYEWILKTGEPIIYREFFDNFGGAKNAVPYFKRIGDIYYSEYERILISDSDIVLYKDPFDEDFDFGGYVDAINPRHISGQCQIYKPEVLKRVVEYPWYQNLVQNLAESGISVADDTLSSWVATMEDVKIKDFADSGYWLHEKLYSLEDDYK